MLKKACIYIIVVLLLNLACYAPVAAATTPPDEAKHTAKVKAAIAKLGTGPDARVEVKLRDGMKLKGYVSASDNGGFVVTDAKSGAATPVTYPQVKKIKGNNLSTGAKIAIGVGIVAAILLALFLIGHTDED